MRPLRNPTSETSKRTPRTRPDIAVLTEFIKNSGAFTFTGEKYIPKGLLTFLEEPEPPDIDLEEDSSDAEQ